MLVYGYEVDSSKDKTSLAYRKKYCGVYIGEKFFKDGEFVSDYQLKKSGKSNVLKERYLHRVSVNSLDLKRNTSTGNLSPVKYSRGYHRFDSKKKNY